MNAPEVTTLRSAAWTVATAKSAHVRARVVILVTFLLKIVFMVSFVSLATAAAASINILVGRLKRAAQHTLSKASELPLFDSIHLS